MVIVLVISSTINSFGINIVFIYSNLFRARVQARLFVIVGRFDCCIIKAQPLNVSFVFSRKKLWRRQLPRVDVFPLGNVMTLCHSSFCLAILEKSPFSKLPADVLCVMKVSLEPLYQLQYSNAGEY